MKCFKTVSPFLICFIILATPILAYSNLLPNPSFEEAGSSLGPGNWKKWPEGSSAATWTWESNRSHTEERSISIKNFSGQSVGVLTEPINVVPNNQYIVSAWVKAENRQSGTAFLRVSLYADGVWQQDIEFTSYLLQNGTWLRFSNSFIVPEGVTSVAVGVGVASSINSGAIIYIDDVALYSVPNDSFWLKTSVDNNAEILVNEQAYGGYLHYIYSGNYGSLFYRLPKTLPPGTYRYRVRYFGHPTYTGRQRIYIHAADGQHISTNELIPIESDGNFHYAEGLFESPKEFTGIRIKRDGVAVINNPIDWIWIGPEGATFSEAEMAILSAPRNLVANYDGPSIVKLEWSPPPSESPIAVYQVFRGFDPDFPMNESALVANTKECFFTEQMDTSQPTYYYKVAAWNDIYGGFKSPAAKISIKSDNTPPNPPKNVSATMIDSGVVEVSWQAPDPAADGDIATTYRIYRMNAGESIDDAVLRKEVRQQDPEFTECKWRDLGMDTGTYVYAVISTDAAGFLSEAEYSTAVSVEADQYPPEAPVSLIYAVEETPYGDPVPEGAVWLEWDVPAQSAYDGDYASFYKVYRSKHSNPRQSGELIATIPAVVPVGQKVSFLDITGIGGNAYYYVVTVLDKALNESTASSPSVLVQVPVPSFPSNISPVDGIPAIGVPVLSWSKVEPQRDLFDYYLLELARDQNFQSNKSEITITSNESASGMIEYVLTEPLTIGRWYWRVMAVYKSGVKSRYSDVGEFTLIETSQLPLRAYTQVSPKFFSPRRGEEISLYVVFNEEAEVTISVYQLNGKLVRNLRNRMQLQPGQIHQIKWNGEDASGLKVRNGIYLILVEGKTANEKSRQVKRVQVYN